MNISKLSVKRPIAVTMIVLIFVVIGVYSMSMLPMEMMPEMELSMALVYTSYPNVGSQEVENLVTKTIEGAVSSVSGAKGITAQSSEGSSMVMIEFSTGTNMDKAIQDLKDSVSLVEAYLPEEAEEPMVLKLDTSMMPVAMISVTYEGMDLIQTKKFVEDNITPKLEAVDGVASVSVTGAQDRIIEVEVDPQKLFGYGVSISDAVSAIAAQNANLPAGSVMSGDRKFSLRAMGKFDSVDDIEAVPLVTPQGQVIHLRDIATVTDTYSDVTTISRLNSDESLAITISSESDANTVDVVDGIYTALDSLKVQNPKFKYEMTMEQASYIKDSISSVASNAVTGAILAVLILLLFLASIKTSLVIGISMPIAVVTTFIGMYFSGMTLNVVSLGGLALGVGMLVDNAVVVLENIFRRRKQLGEDSRTSAINGASEVFGAVVASVITTCIVYVPLLFVDNIMAVMFKQLAFAIIFSQIAALAVTYLLVPMLTARIKEDDRNQKLGFILNPFARFMDRMYALYERALRRVLSRRKVFMLSVMGVFVLSLVVLGMIGMTLMNSTDEGTLSVSIELPNGSTLADTNDITLKAEEIISGHKDVDKVFSSVGSGGMSMLGQSSSNASTVTVTLKENRKSTTNEAAQEIREQLSNIAGAVITVDVSSSMSMGSGGIEFEFTGNDDAELEKYVRNAEKVLAGIDGVVETSTSISDTKPEIQMIIDSDKAARYGLSTATIAGTVNGILSGTTAGRYTEGGLEYDIDLVYPDGYGEDVNSLKSMQIKTMTGQWIALSDVADIVEKEGYTTLTRVDQKRVITLSGKLFDVDMATVNSVFEKAMEQIPVPDGVSRNTGGEFEIMIDAMLSLLLAIALGILLMYLVMASQFESLSQPLIIMFTLPLALIGVVLSHVIAGMPLSVVSCLGILMLMGI
ncbi:MAG: efflux RND transporter permease subunit, partial [Clostridia bacterium]|nr:efflux RND transporter permease subunit [Clostridia bacterium]